MAIPFLSFTFFKFHFPFFHTFPILAFPIIVWKNWNVHAKFQPKPWWCQNGQHRNYLIPRASCDPCLKNVVRTTWKFNRQLSQLLHIIPCKNGHFFMGASFPEPNIFFKIPMTNIPSPSHTILLLWNSECLVLSMIILVGNNKKSTRWPFFIVFRSTLAAQWSSDSVQILFWGKM